MQKYGIFFFVFICLIYQFYCQTPFNKFLSLILCCRLNVVITVLRDEKKIKEKILHNMQEKNSRSLAVKSHETLFNFLPMVQGYVKLGSLKINYCFLKFNFKPTDKSTGLMFVCLLMGFTRQYVLLCLMIQNRKS